MDRRRFLLQGGALGCSLAAAPLLTPVALASAPSDNRLVVIVLRGAMDGLDVVAPLGDPNLALWRPGLVALPGRFDLDGFYAMHPGLSDLAPLWQAGELGFVHAVSTPYRDKRSHFDGQDILEEGGADSSGGVRDGWLNRLLQEIPGARSETAYAVGRERMLILKGAAATSSWSPEARLGLSPQALRLVQMVQQGDPLFEQASAEAADIAGAMAAAAEAPDDVGSDGDMMAMPAAGLAGEPARLAGFVADRLREETRIASFSISGWDTHLEQERGLLRPLGQLASAIQTLRGGLGPVWAKTTIACITEFGRTVRENGSRGTDHGTGGAMILAGGALRGGRVVADWPGLAEADLYADRDLRPTRDLRAHLGWILRDLYGVAASQIEAAVFPGLDLGDNPGHLG